MAIVTLSAFMRYLEENKKRLPRQIYVGIQADAERRVIDRYKAGRADGPLNFADLVERGEASLQPK